MVTTTTERVGILVDRLLPSAANDALIATKVMRWTYMPLQAGRISASAWAEWIDPRGHTQWAGIDGGFHPWTDDVAAMQIASAWRGDFTLKKQNDMWYATFYQPSEEFEASSGVRQVAVCRAALKSVGIYQVPI